MSEPIVLPARLEGGKLDLNRDRLRKALHGRKDGDYLITIERAHATRSLSQNAYYWGVILPAIADYTGQSVDDLHEWAKLNFNAKQIVLTNAHGEIVGDERIGQTTTKLNKVTFGEYLERLRAWAAVELGVVVPDPDPDHRWRKDHDEEPETTHV